MGFLSVRYWELYLQALILICAFTFIYYTWRTKIPLVPTQAAARNAVMTVLQAEIEARRGEKIRIYDLGSGLGGLCRAIAWRFPVAEVVGIEMAWPMWLLTFARQKLLPYNNLQFLHRDFWKYEISDGDIVVFYLGDVVMAAMGEKLRKEARPGCLIISNTFPLPKDWVPAQRIPIAAWLSKEIFVYRQVG